MGRVSLALDPVAIRQALEFQRRLGTPFDEAWTQATHRYRHSADADSLHQFMRRNFRAAYYDTPSPLGSCRVPARDVSASVMLLPKLHPSTSDSEFCLSGDGCDRLATCGRFGKKWCEHHGADLQRIAKRIGGSFQLGPIQGTKGRPKT